MAVLFFALGIGFTILIQAGLAFVGVMDPFVPSWGIILRNAYNSGTAGYAYWWVLPPGFLISFTGVSAFMFGRKLEAMIGGEETEETLQL
jgi:peptide/nickel transport system permease protein